MNPLDEERDEEQLACFLTSTEKDAVSPDREFLARLREQSTEAFAQASLQQLPIEARKRRTMSRIAGRLATAAAAAMVVGIGLHFWLSPEPPGLTLGEVLDTFDTTDTAHLRLTNRVVDARHEVWHTSRPKRWRSDSGRGAYSIGDESNYWFVVEKLNQVKSFRSPNPFAEMVLVGVAAAEYSEELLHARPVKRSHEHGIEILTYRLKVPRLADPIVWVDAVLDSNP